jgi:prolipoprotein diacylglyceryltransferase
MRRWPFGQTASKGAATILGCYKARPMNPLVIPYPEIDPVLVQLGPLAIRWYALAYIAGLVIGWQVIRRLCEQSPKVMTPAKIDDFLLWAALGVILGGRASTSRTRSPS